VGFKEQKNYFAFLKLTNLPQYLPSRKHSLKAGLNNGDYHSKLAVFKAQLIFSILKTNKLRAIFAIV
jgi:hypothetical protein